MRLSREVENQESLDQQEETMQFIEASSQAIAENQQQQQPESESDGDKDSYDINVEDFKKMNDQQKFFAQLSFEGVFPSQLQDKNGQTLLHHCSIKGYRNKAKFLVDNLFCDVSTRDTQNYTAFDYAAAYGNKRVSEYLLLTGLVTPGH